MGGNTRWLASLQARKQGMLGHYPVIGPDDDDFANGAQHNAAIGKDKY